MEYPIDYHMHLERAGITRGNAMRFIERAMEVGISEVAFTEHSHNFVETAGLLRQPGFVSRHGHRFSADDYVDLALGLKREGLPVRLGIEFDYIEESSDAIAEFLKRHPWDVVLGSVHWLGDWGFDISPESWNGRQVEDAYRRYFTIATRAVGSGIFDVLGHPDVIKVFGARPGPDFEPELLHLYDDLISAAARTGTCLELSSAGLRRPVGEAYPDARLLARAKAGGVGITLASDAHEPDDVGSRFAEIVAIARDSGYSEVTGFQGRRRRAVALS
ncbi:MAG: histidinol-phosphatase HisJ family protein [Clostridia bacterium]|nr:histidinol-phosphatase HisJ family protein [Clostridia bacterium]